MKCRSLESDLTSSGGGGGGGGARLCAKYLNTASSSEVKFHIQSGTDETKNKAPLWKPVEARKIGLKSAQPQMS